MGHLHLRGKRETVDVHGGIVITSVSTRNTEHVQVDVLQGSGMVGNKIVLEDPDLRRKKRLQRTLKKMAKGASSSGAAFRTLNAPAGLWTSKREHRF